jgi:TonB family protein
MIEYIIKVNVAIVIVFAVHKLILTKSNSYQFNRFFMLIGIFLSLMVPFISSLQLTDNYLVSIALPTYDSTLSAVSASNSNRFNVLTFWYTIYALVTAGFLIQFFISILKIYSIKKASLPLNYNGTTIWENKNSQHFSFFNFMVVSDQINQHELKPIVKHEQTHIKELHSLDVLLIEALKIVFWFNPAVWMLKNEITTNHEFIADLSASQEDELAYFQLLVNHAKPDHNLLLTQQFAKPSLTRIRISKLNNKSLKPNTMKNTIAMFVAGAMLTALSCTSQVTTPDTDQIKKVKKAEELDIQPQYPGGMEAMFTYLGENIKYPEDAKNDSIEGTVYVQFLVSETGELKEVKSIKKVHASLDESAVKTISTMPNWTPGKIGEKAYAVKMILPIKFALK